MINSHSNQHYYSLNLPDFGHKISFIFREGLLSRLFCSWNESIFWIVEVIWVIRASWPRIKPLLQIAPCFMSHYVHISCIIERSEQIPEIISQYFKEKFQVKTWFLEGGGFWLLNGIFFRNSSKFFYLNLLIYLFIDENSIYICKLNEFIVRSFCDAL